LNWLRYGRFTRSRTGQSALPDFAFPSRDMKFERERQAGYLFDAALPYRK
jgi:hypothetical protein